MRTCLMLIALIASNVLAGCETANGVGAISPALLKRWTGRSKRTAASDARHPGSFKDARGRSVKAAFCPVKVHPS